MNGVNPFDVVEGPLGAGSSNCLNFCVLFFILSQTTSRIQRERAPRRLQTIAPIAAGGNPA
jgi:hypothetical protein